MTMTGERLTWAEICAKFPEMWVGLDDVRFKADKANVESAVVAVAAEPADYPSAHVKAFDDGHDYLFMATFGDLGATSGVMV